MSTDLKLPCPWEFEDSETAVGSRTPSGSEVEPNDNRKRSLDQDGAVHPASALGMDDSSSCSKNIGKKQRFLVVIALSMAMFLAALDMTIIATALPTISQHFNSSQSSYIWMASSYLLANAASLPLWGKLSDIWGRRPVILAANFLFLAGSLVSALAAGAAVLIAGRCIQGLGGGGLIVLSQICVSDLFSISERPKYYAMFGAVWAVAGASGPVIGGSLAQEVAWRWCFYINLPIGGVTFAVLLSLLTVESPRRPLLAGLAAIDWLGTICVIGGTTMLLLGLEFGGILFAWNSTTTICLLVFGVIVLALFALIESKIARNPIMPAAVFRSMSNILLLGCNWSHATIWIGGAYFLPIYFQVVLGANPVLSGIYILPIVLSIAITSVGTSYVVHRTGWHVEAIRLGAIFSVIGFGLFIDLTPSASWPKIIIYQIIAGIGVGINFQAPLIAIQSAMRTADVASGTATFAFVRHLSTSISIVVGGVVYQNMIKKSASKLIEALGGELAPSFTGTIAGKNIEMMPLLTEWQRDAFLQEFGHAIACVRIFYASVAATGLVLSWILRPEKGRQRRAADAGLETDNPALSAE